jgi:hypothetical protein
MLMRFDPIRELDRSEVLTVTIPVNERARPRRVEVTSSGQGDQKVLTEH